MYFPESKWGFVSQCLNELPIVLCKKCIKKHGFMHPGAYFMHVLFNSDKFAFIRKVSIILAVSRKAKADGECSRIAHWKEWLSLDRESCALEKGLQHYSSMLLKKGLRHMSNRPGLFLDNFTRAMLYPCCNSHVGVCQSMANGWRGKSAYMKSL